MVYTEFRTVEKPIIEWLQKIGWKYVSPEDLKRDVEEPLHLPTLKESLKRLNPGVIQTDEDMEKVINQLRRPLNDITGNKEFFEWFKGERSLILKAGQKAKTIKLIDFGSLENNSYVVTSQFKFAGHENVRFDIVLMVNGVPLAVIEAKLPTKAGVDYHNAIEQIQRYDKQAPQFLKYLAFTCVTDGITLRYDWVARDKFFEWKSEQFPDPVKSAVFSLFGKRTFLDVISNFIVFEKEREQVRKKAAMYQQVRAANLIVERVLAGKVKTGLVWHFQGSGKTLTMLFAAWKLKKTSQLNNPTILLIVDRIDLEGQLWGTFSNVDFPYTAKAESTRDLVSKLKQESREVIITTIQKFEDFEEVLSEQENLIVFVDEAHRSQYGKLAMRMRRAFPNAFIFGFTGTPIEKGALGKSTFRTFCPPGEKYLDRYGIRESIEDGATVRIVYEPRLEKFHVPAAVLDREFLDKTAGLADDEQQRVIDKSATLKTILKSKERIDKIAQDIAEHYKTHVEPNRFKAQLVAVDREGCALYKEALDKYLPPEYSTVIYTKNPNDIMHPLLNKYNMPKEDQLQIARVKFQKPNENPRILIVTDMLLTGFDAPIEQVMYLDKPLRDHRLLQAIARTNRPYPKKEAGIIIDYVGIFKRLVKALNFETSDIQGVAVDLKRLKDEFKKTMTATLKIFAGITREDSRDSLFAALKAIENEETLKQFKRGLSKVRRLYETIAPDPDLFDFDDPYTWLIEVNEAYNKLRDRKLSDLSEYEEKTRELIKEKLVIQTLEKILPTFEINRDYLKSLEREKLAKGQRIMEMKAALESRIRINLERNPIYESLSRRLERIVKIKNESQLESELRQLVQEVAEVEERARAMNVTDEEFALLNAVKKYVEKAEDSELIPFVRELLKDVKAGGRLFKGWQRKASVTKEVQQVVFDKCFEKFRDALEVEKIMGLSEEMENFIERYN
jgi:type I restriction enzyme R subunit